MSKEVYLNEVESTTINEERVSQIENLYKTKLSELVKKIISHADRASFFEDERRALTYSEIINPLDSLGCDFISLNLIPIIDVYDNTYIVFDYMHNTWGEYNISDEILFNESNTFQELL